MLTGIVRAKEACAEDAGRWGICGVGLMPWDVKLMDALKSQDYLYTLVTRDPDTNFL